MGYVGVQRITRRACGSMGDHQEISRGTWRVIGLANIMALYSPCPPLRAGPCEHRESPEGHGEKWVITRRDRRDHQVACRGVWGIMPGWGMGLANIMGLFCAYGGVVGSPGGTEDNETGWYYGPIHHVFEDWPK